MHFSVFLPPQPGPHPVLWYLSGLTCTDLNVVEKSGFQRVAAERGIAVVCPDTSPRGADIPGEDDDWDFGSGAGYYLDATAEPWKTNYNMATYTLEELPSIVFDELNVNQDAQGVLGHSMGGHGALVSALRSPGRYQSVSAFAPICAPTQVPWGKKAFGSYLCDENEWAGYDATELILAGKTCSRILIDQGTADNFLERELKPELLVAACNSKGQPIDLRMREGYDHSYYFIASFMADHIHFHADQLSS